MISDNICNSSFVLIGTDSTGCHYLSLVSVAEISRLALFLNDKVTTCDCRIMSTINKVLPSKCVPGLCASLTRRYGDRYYHNEIFMSCQ